MTQLAAPNVNNYTFGAHELLVGAGAGTTLGNVVNASVSVSVEDVQHFSALFGGDRADPAIIRSMDISIEATLDEPNQANLLYFFQADSSFRVGMNPYQIARVQFKGIPVVGNIFTWDIPKVSIRPNGNFGYNDQDWATFGLTFRVLYNAATPTAPYGTVTHSGV